MDTKGNTRNSNLSIYPFAFIRYASGHHAEFEQLKLTGWKNFQNNLNIISNELSTVRDELVNFLFTKIAITEHSNGKQILINLKRSIYNYRTLPPLPPLSNILSELDINRLDHYTKLTDEKQLLIGQWELHYANHLAVSHSMLQQLSSNELFLKAVRLSSKDLFDQVLNYINIGPDKLRRKDFRIEYGLMRYLTRMYFKTSPFSTFTHIGLSRILPSPDTLLLPTKYKVLSRVRLNHALYDHLKNLLSTHDEINNSLSVICNPTIKCQEGRITFLINFHNVESFQELNVNPVIKLILEIYNSSSGEISLNNIIENLKHEIDASRPQIKSYLMNLINIGLLEFDFQVSALSSDWEMQLINYLEKRDCSHLFLRNTIELLKKLDFSIKSYENANVKKRNAILAGMVQDSQINTDKFLESFGLQDTDQQAYKLEYQQKFDMQSFKRNPYLFSTLHTENIIYEDSYTQESATIDADGLTEVVKKVNKLGECLSPFNIGALMKKELTFFFRSNFDLDEEVDLLQFYHRYSRIEKDKIEPQIERDPTYDNRWNGFHNESYMESLSILKNALTNAVVPGADQLDISALTFRGLRKMDVKPPIQLSRAMFTQFFTADKKLVAIVNSVFLGMGRASGRFLHLFDKDVIEQQRIFNNGVTDEHMLMELSDASIFNANLHPMLLPYIVKIPNGQTATKSDRQIAVKDISVYYDDAHDELRLRDKHSRKRIIPFDLCLQSISQRSKLYQLLSQFAVDPGINFGAIREAVYGVLYGARGSASQTDIYTIPRVVYEGQLVIQRKNWTVRTQSIPKDKDYASEAEYFLRLNEWRISHDIPAKVFLYIRLGSQAAETKSDDYKPQYICFETPIMLLLWSKLLKKSDEYIYLEEMLPHPEQLNEDVVHETLIQWYGS